MVRRERIRMSSSASFHSDMRADDGDKRGSDDVAPLLSVYPPSLASLLSSHLPLCPALKESNQACDAGSKASSENLAILTDISTWVCVCHLSLYSIPSVVMHLESSSIFLCQSLKKKI